MRLDAEWVAALVWTFCVSTLAMILITEICNILDGAPRWFGR